MKLYIVTYEYSDGTHYSIQIPARNKEDAMKFIEAKFKDSRALRAEEMSDDTTSS